MFLSVVIPTFNRGTELLYSLNILKEQVLLLNDDVLVEIIVCDDASTDNTEEKVKPLEQSTPFIQYIKYDKNIGLENNLVECTRKATGEYLWIFGDDDFLECDNALSKIINKLKSYDCDLMILNRTRRSFSLDNVISSDWMGITGGEDMHYSGLPEFYREWGFISVIGFITVNVMRRKSFIEAFDDQFFGTMYPQLGMMTRAFSNADVTLVTEPLICHRTQTAQEKAKAFEDKKTEQVFMSDTDRRDAFYFGAPYIRMLNLLVKTGSLSYEDINNINENTVINGRLIDFLLNNIVKAVNFGADISDSDQLHINSFFSNVDLSQKQIYQMSRYSFMTDDKFNINVCDSSSITISVVTPSYNQVQFFHECLDAVFEQTHQPLEQIVLDPGSTDGSLNVARYYKHVTLINEPDEGQGDAVAKGISMARGDVIAWVNSDDSYFDKHVFSTIAKQFTEDDEIIYGNGIFMAGNGSKLRDVYINKDPSTLSWRFQQEDGILQPALFFKRSVIEKIGLPSKYLEFCMDYEYWIRAMKAGVRFRHVDKNFAKAYFHIDNKTYGQRGASYQQVCDMQFEQFGYANHVWLRRYAEYLIEGFDGVVAHSQNSEIKNETLIVDAYLNLMRQYNTNAGTLELLTRRSSEKGYGDTLRELKIHDLIPSHYQEIKVGSPQSPGSVNYEMGGKLWCFDKSWKDQQISKSHDFFRKAIKERKNETCILICNGPSLNKVDKSLFAKADVIASNNIFLSDEIIQHVDFFTCVNYLVAEQSAPQINGLSVNKIFPWWLAYCINESNNTYFVDAKGFPEFSTDFFNNMSWRHTVTFFNMHLAYGLGYKKVLLVGCDHNYKQPSGVKEEELIHSSEDDNNHFDPRYFKSKKWQAADVAQMEAMYELAKIAFEHDGREIINCTDGGALELFRRASLESELEKEAIPKISQLLKPTLLEGPYSREDKIHFDETDLISAYVGEQKNGFMIDVGTHHGYASSPFLDKGWSVLGFEPDPNNRKILKQRLGDHPGLKIIQDAVSDVAGETVSFYASDESTGVSGLSGFTEKHKIICEVKTTTLTDQIRENNISTIDFLKIDTEGFDLMVLKGFPWKTRRPSIIECEFENTKTVPLGYTFEDIADYLVDHGYHVYVSEWHPIIRYGIQHNWRSLSRYPCALATDAAWGNLLAFDTVIDEKQFISKLRGLAKLDTPVKQAKNKGSEETVFIPTLFNRVNIRLSAMLMPYPRLHTMALGVSARIKNILHK